MKFKIVLLTVCILALASINFAQSKTPSFTRYASKVETIKNVKVNLKSHKNAPMFRTNLRNAAKEGVNFAGHYVLTSWGCGTSCMEAAIIDARTGKVFFPTILQGVGAGFCDLPDDVETLDYKLDSRLLVLSGFKGETQKQETGKCGIYYFEWTGANFKQLKYIPKKSTL